MIKDKPASDSYINYTKIKNTCQLTHYFLAANKDRGTEYEMPAENCRHKYRNFGEEVKSESAVPVEAIAVYQLVEAAHGKNGSIGGGEEAVVIDPVGETAAGTRIFGAVETNRAVNVYVDSCPKIFAFTALPGADIGIQVSPCRNGKSCHHDDHYHHYCHGHAYGSLHCVFHFLFSPLAALLCALYFMT